jgi:predicted  nucleic acid-binding Zn-ribbon protein
MIMNTTLNDLVRLQELTRRYENSGHPASQHKRIVHLRGSLPANFLRRFDHLAEHGRLPVAQVSASGACGSCHLKLTPSDVLQFRHTQETRAENIPQCPFCGCFLYSPAAVADSKELAEAGL